MDKARILVAEDDPVSLMILVDILESDGFELTSVPSGAEAWSLVSATPDQYDVILLDRQMPGLDGIEVLRRIKDDPDLVNTPVIMQTSMTSEADVVEGLRAGAYYYLTKPFSPDTLLAIVAAAANDRRHRQELRGEVRKAARTLVHLVRAEFQFRTPREARDIATLVANAAPDPDRVVLGLSELMLNAVEHGNLGITYEEKTALVRDDALPLEIDRRLAWPENAGKRATLVVDRLPGELRFYIRDDGVGFDWQAFLEMSPARAFDVHGRGIALARMISFDRLEYFGSGNQVLGAVTL